MSCEAAVRFVRPLGLGRLAQLRGQVASSLRYGARVSELARLLAWMCCGGGIPAPGHESSGVERLNAK